ncbi:MAG: hypothetical protein R3330_00180, partial [Saprospiraceae bacterium]|nr:hypothetical protein [Saprospiraceae bacterium]
YHPGSDDDIYIGTEIGVFFKDASLGIADWLYFSTYLPNTMVNDLVIEDGYVYAGTFGRGMWRSPVYSCPGTLSLTPANDPNTGSIGQREFNAVLSITSSRVIQGNTADVKYGAGDHIDLVPGFWAKSGNALEAKVEGCPN